MSLDPGLISGISYQIGNSVLALEQPATLQSQLSGQTVTASYDFTFFWKGQCVNFWANMTTAVDAALLSALQAQSAPITTP